MMRILVTGADGFVGNLLCPTLQAAGYAVRRAVWEALPSHDPAFDWVVVGDIGPTTDWTAALKDVEVVIHLAGRVHMVQDPAQDPLAEFRRINTAGTQRLAQMAAAAQIKRFVFTSTLHVTGEQTTADKPFVESDPPKPVSPYAISKWEAEQALQAIAAETGLNTVIIRPALVYGPGVKGNFLRLMQLVHKGIPLPLSSTRNQRSFVSRTNLVDFLVRCVEHPAALGETFLISDNEDVSTSALIRKIAHFLQRPARLFPIPERVMRAVGAVTGQTKTIDRLWGSLAVDSSKARDLLDWQPVISMDEEIAGTARWFEEGNRPDGG